jgi:hypothetical protein
MYSSTSGEKSEWPLFQVVSDVVEAETLSDSTGHVKLDHVKTYMALACTYTNELNPIFLSCNLQTTPGPVVKTIKAIAGGVKLGSGT